jgi:hypothetical protein
MPYLISYYVAGALFAIASARQHRSSMGQHLGRSLLIMNFWPLLLFLAPELLAIGATIHLIWSSKTFRTSRKRLRL